MCLQPKPKGYRVKETENVLAIEEPVHFPLSLSVKETYRIKIRGM